MRLYCTQKDAEELEDMAYRMVPKDYRNRVADPKERLKIYDLMVSLPLSGHSTGVWKPRVVKDSI